MSLSLLLGTELQVDVEAGLTTYGISAPGPYVAAIEALGVTHVPVTELTRSWDPGQDLAAARALARTLRSLRLDVLHTHNPKTGVLGRLLGRVLGIPVVVNTCHGLWVQPEDRLAKKALVYGAEALAAQASHAELYQNAADHHTLRKAVPGWRSRVVGNGVDLTRFRPDPAARLAVRRELGVADDELLVGGVGRRVAEKGIREYAAAARKLAGKAQFVWIGPEDSDKPDALATDEAGVRFLGNRSDMPAVYAALDVFVLPSYREGFSRSAMEAAACGTAMVLSDIRGCREIGTHEREVLLVPPRDEDALADAVLRLLVDDDLRVALATASRQRAQGEFDQRAVAAVSLATYAAVARRRGLGWSVGEA
jgi:glycosyltransferase involved in cell wall biosynthesis